jgi:hypothetical protein
MIMEQQDRQLDSVLNTVTNLRNVAHVMGEELDGQNMWVECCLIRDLAWDWHLSRLLQELESDIDRTQSHLNRATGKVKEVLRKSRGK